MRESNRPALIISARAAVSEGAGQPMAACESPGPRRAEKVIGPAPETAEHRRGLAAACEALPTAMLRPPIESSHAREGPAWLQPEGPFHHAFALSPALTAPPAYPFGRGQAFQGC